MAAHRMWFPLGRFDEVLKCSAFLAFQQIDDNRLLGFALTQSKSPGDFWFYDQDKNPVIGVEVKDKSKNIGFEIIGAIENRKENNPTLTTYFAVTASKIAVKEAVIKDKFWLQNIARIRNDLDLNIITLSFLDICSLLIFLQVDHSKILHRANELIIKMDDLKKDTMDKWIEFVG